MERITYEEALHIQRAVAEKFGVRLHLHDACGGQYFSLDEPSAPIAAFLRETFSDYLIEAQGEQYFTFIGRKKRC